MIDLENIIAVASEATQGGWKIGKTVAQDTKMVLSEKGKYVATVQIHQTPRSAGMSDEAERLANAQFITTCNPETVLEMAREIQRLQAYEKRLKAVAAEYYEIEPFEIPTGAGDADVGWRVKQWHCGETAARVVSETFNDDVCAAIDAAMGGELKCKP